MNESLSTMALKAMTLVQDLTSMRYLEGQAKVLFQRKNYSEAENNLKSLLALDPTYSSAVILLGHA